MKIYSLEIETELGRRVVQLAVPLDIEPRGDMPAPFRSLTDVLWKLFCEAAGQAGQPPAFVAPKVEA